MTYRLHDSLGFRLSRAARIQEKRLDAGLRALGLTRVTWCILLAVGNEDLGRPSDIARFIGIDRTATSRALGQMERDGLIARIAGTGDGRTRRVALTASGEDRLKRGEPLAMANNAAMETQLSVSDIERLKGLLDTLIADEPPLDRL